jgi:hypothetical protein
MIALAHRALDCAVNAFLRVFSRSRRACRLAAPSSVWSTDSGRVIAARSARRSPPRYSATRSSTCSSSGVVRNRVLIATPDGPATGFTPRHSRSFPAVTHSIIPNRYDKFGSSINGPQTGSCSQPALSGPPEFAAQRRNNLLPSHTTGSYF